ncbi:MAG TPA: branched-chain amino acid ABC transporter permease, partial [Dehalococcoidia bacterium]|nr:branched-chain amino acid ABC transporter permease [Dehalococcoidia bacterium]
MNLVKLNPARTKAAERGWRAWIDDHPALGLALVLLVLPFVLPEKSLAAEILTFGLFALSFNLLLGYTGLLSFGHSTFLGLGSYAAAIFLIRVGANFWGALALGMLVPTLFATIIGWFSLRRREVYFAMLTLAFNQMVFFVFFQLRWLTGGDDGLRGIPIPDLAIPGLFSLDIDVLRNPLRFFFVTYAIVVACFFALQRIVHSPFGRALQAIRESEERARACGYDTNRLQLLSFVFAGLFAGVAGALNVLLYGFVALESLNWLMAGVVVIMTIAGGAGTFVGPIIGAAFYLFFQEYLSKLTANWPFYFGGLFVLIVLFLPAGIWGT